MQFEHAPGVFALQAQADISTANPKTIIRKMYEHLAEHDADLVITEDGAVVTFFFGAVSMKAQTDGILIGVTAPDDSQLALMKQITAWHLFEFMAPEKPKFIWTGDGADIKKFPNLHEMTVKRVSDPTPNMRRIALSGPGLESYIGGGLHAKLFLPSLGVTKPEWPVPGPDGMAVWPSAERRPEMRTYTVRNLDVAAREIEIDFVLHGDQSVGSRWAMHARPGNVIGMRGPMGLPVPEAEWYLLVGDETALPAIARILETLPASAKGVAFIEVADASEEQPIHFQADISLNWLHRDGAEPGTTILLIDAVRAVAMPPADTSIHAMAGVEYSAFKAIRRYWRDELKLTKKQVLAVSYWRRGQPEGINTHEDEDH